MNLPGPRSRGPSFLTIALAFAVPLVLLTQVANAQSMSQARAHLNFANEYLDRERFDEVEPTLQKAEKYLDGLPDADKAPILKQISEVRAKLEPAKKAAAAAKFKKKIESELYLANDDLGPRPYDVEKRLKGIEDRLASDEAKKTLEAADITAFKGRVDEIRKKLSGGEAAKPAQPVEANLSAAKGRVRSARSLAESRRFENVEATLEEAETFMNGLPEAEKAPLLKDMAEIRALLAEGEKAEKARIYESQLRRYIDGARDTHPDAEADLLKKTRELLASEEVRSILGAAKIEEFRGRLAEVEASIAARKKAFALDRAAGFAQQLEDAFAGDPLEGKDEFEAYKAWRELDYHHRAARKWLADIPENDAERRAMEERLAGLKTKIDASSSKWSTAQVESAVKGGWDFAAQSFEGWDKETPKPGVKPNESWTMMKTITAARSAAHWLDDEQMKKLCSANAGNAVVKSTVAGAEKTRDSALAKLNEAFNASMGTAEKLPTPIRETRFDRPMATWMMHDAEDVFRGSKYQAPNVARAKALDDRWEKEIQAIIQKAKELRDKLSKEADKAWPAIVAEFGPEEDFRVRQLARSKGDRIIIKGAYNRTLWDFDDKYDFTVRIDGVAIGGNYTQGIKDAIQKMWEKMDAPPLDSWEKWDVIGVVEGPTKINRRVTTKIIDSVTREEIGKIEGYEAEDGVELKIIGLRAGPIAVGSK